MILLLLASFVLSLLFYKVFRFATADADLALLAKGPHRAGAFQDKVVWVTGASQGFGAVLVTHFAAHGAKLILSSRKADKLESIKASCGASPANVAVVPFDLCGSYEELADAASKADSAFGGVDFLVHNAGASMHALAEEVSAKVTDQMFALNTLGPIKLTRAALPHMLRRGRGRIVVIGSMASKVPSPGQAVYSGCKMALYGYFSTLATEICGRGIGVTICCPGPLSTPPDAPPRVVYGAEGLVERPNELGSKGGRVTQQRCAQLIANAAAHGVDECWIAGHPILAIGYVFQFLPWLGWLVLKKVGPSRARALKEGKSGYDYKNMVSGEAAASR